MPEISPRITYSPEGVLELRRTFDSEREDFVAALEKRKNELDSLPAYSVRDDGQDTVVQVEVAAAIQKSPQSKLRNPSAEQLVENLTLFTHFDFEDARDGVFSLDFWNERGATGNIHPHFQRWLNAEILPEDVAKSCINAMAYPFGAEERRRAKKEFRYRTDGHNAVAYLGALSYRVVSKREKFGVSELQGDGEDFTSRRGEVLWNWPDFSTLGDCACWGADGQDRDSVYITPDTNRLYELKPHNVDYAVQSLSLVLGAATLAYAAAQYKGQEDILEHAEWRSP